MVSDQDDKGHGEASPGEIPVIGNWRVRVDAVRPFTIHGDLYYELIVTAAGNEEAHSEDPGRAPPRRIIRVPQHALATTRASSTGEPRPGDRFELSFLMGQVTTARRIQP